MTILKLNKRTEVGKSNSRKIRREGQVPGVVYKKGAETEHVYGLEKEIMKIYEEMGTSNIFKANVNGEDTMVLIKEIQKDPIKNHILNFDLQAVDRDQKIRLSIPVVLEGKDDIKIQPSNLIQVLDEVEIECLPLDLPSEAKVNVASMETGDVFEVKDLDIAANDRIEILTSENDTVATLQDIIETSDEEENAEETEASEVPTVKEEETEK